MEYTNFDHGYFISEKNLSEAVSGFDPTVVGDDVYMLLESLGTESICYCSYDSFKNFYEDELVSGDYLTNMYIRGSLRAAQVVMQLINEQRFPTEFYVLR